MILFVEISIIDLVLVCSVCADINAENIITHIPKLKVFINLFLIITVTSHT